VEPIATKDELVLALRDAAEIEQQLMCEYLYAALSLKSGPDERCTPSQFEFVRRWCSTIAKAAGRTTSREPTMPSTRRVSSP
jgi:hypothetical protein